MPQPNYNNIILFDGVCSLCNRTVVFILKNDKKERFRFASLQSAIGQEILLHFDKQIATTKYLNSVYLILDDKLLEKSDAALQIAKRLKFPYILGFIAIFIPRFLRNAVYDYIAQNRYKWFGKTEMCALHNPSWKHRILS